MQYQYLTIGYLFVLNWLTVYSVNKNVITWINVATSCSEIAIEICNIFRNFRIHSIWQPYTTDISDLFNDTIQVNLLCAIHQFCHQFCLVDSQSVLLYIVCFRVASVAYENMSDLLYSCHLSLQALLYNMAIWKTCIINFGVFSFSKLYLAHKSYYNILISRNHSAIDWYLTCKYS